MTPEFPPPTAQIDIPGDRPFGGKGVAAEVAGREYAPVDELLSFMNDMLNDYPLHCKWPDGYAGEPQKPLK